MVPTTGAPWREERLNPPPSNHARYMDTFLRHRGPQPLYWTDPKPNARQRASMGARLCRQNSAPPPSCTGPKIQGSSCMLQAPPRQAAGTGSRPAVQEGHRWEHLTGGIQYANRTDTVRQQKECPVRAHLIAVLFRTWLPTPLFSGRRKGRGPGPFGDGGLCLAVGSPTGLF